MTKGLLVCSLLLPLLTPAPTISPQFYPSWSLSSSKWNCPAVFLPLDLCRYSLFCLILHHLCNSAQLVPSLVWPQGGLLGPSYLKLQLPLLLILLPFHFSPHCLLLPNNIFGWLINVVCLLPLNYGFQKTRILSFLFSVFKIMPGNSRCSRNICEMNDICGTLSLSCVFI